MKKVFFAAGIICLISFNVCASPDRQNRTVDFSLNTHRVYEIYVHFKTGTTTVMFPGAISKIAGNNISTKIEKDFQGEFKHDFLLQSKDGSYYFNVIALKEGAQGSINVTYRRNTYIIKLLQSETKSYSAVNFGIYKSSRSTGQFRRPSSGRKISMLDIAKAYNLFDEYQPHAIRDVEYFKPSTEKRFEYKHFSIILDEVFRFNLDDTVVFKVLLKNSGSEEIKYDKFSFVAQNNKVKYFQSVADASGIMPPKTTTTAYFAITGTMRGGGNNLPADSDWQILVTAKYMVDKVLAKNEE
jgi:hypothetical protein